MRNHRDSYGACWPRKSASSILGASFPAALLMLGGSHRLAAQEQLLVFEGEWPQGDAYTVAGIGDINQDGRPDLIIGLPQGSATFFSEGLALVVSVASGEILRQHMGWEEYSRLGHFVHDAGDFDGDGVGDYAIVSQEAIAQQVNDPGQVFIHSGATGAELANVAGTVAHRILGEVFAAIGDINGDGFGDVLISNGASPVYVYLGPDLTLARTHVMPGAKLSVAGVGDLNGDGHGDYIIGAPQDSSIELYMGKAVVFSGFDGSELYTIRGIQGKTTSFQGDHLGRSVTGVGDWNFDGVPDFAVGAPGGIQCCSGEGYVRVYSGLDASVLAHIVRPLPATSMASFGTRVVGGQDLNADGFPDLLVGAPWESSPLLEGEGTATVVSGKDQLVLWKVYGSQLFSRMGEHIDFLGDVNGDGFADFAITDGTHEPGGIVIVYGGAPMGTESYCESNPNSTGVGAHLYPEGHLKLRDDRFQIVLQSAVPGQSALLFYGAEVADQPFGDGRMCIAPPHWRLAPPVAAGEAGEAAFRLPLSQPPFASGPGALLPGSTWSFQVWYRDPASTGAGFNTSDALRIQWAPQ